MSKRGLPITYNTITEDKKDYNSNVVHATQEVAEIKPQPVTKNLLRFNWFDWSYWSSQELSGPLSVYIL